MTHSRQKNRGGTRMCNNETTEAKVAFGPSNNKPSLSAGYAPFCITGLQESSPEELLAAMALSWTSSEEHTVPSDLYLVGRGTAPSQKKPQPSLALWASPCPHMISFQCQLTLTVDTTDQRGPLFTVS